MNKKLSYIGIIGMAVFGIVIALGAVLFYKNEKTYVQGNTSYQTLREQKQKVELDKSIEQSKATTDENLSNSLSEEEIVLMNDINPNFSAWIYQEGTSIDYPVVQGVDNEYYLNHLFTGEKNKLGCLFIDYRNSEGFIDKNTVIYGHNMKDGAMFNRITNYKDPEIYSDLPTMTIYTENKTYLLELFAGVVTSGNYEFVRFNFSADEEFMEYVKKLRTESTFDSNIEINPSDKIVTLITCSYEDENSRYALIGRLVEEN